MENTNIGKSIQESRKKKNLSIRDLAALTGVTASLLSQVERGLANPSINTIKIIAKTLDVPLFSFFMDFNDTKSIVVRSNGRKKVIFPENKNFTYELLSPDLSGAIELALMKLPPHSHSSEELMDHDGEEAAYIMDNQVELHLENQVIVLNAGDSVRIFPRMKHKWENPFENETNVIFAITPPRF